MASTEVGQRAVPPQASQPPEASSRFDWGITVLSVWVIVGFYLDLWAHASPHAARARSGRTHGARQ